MALLNLAAQVRGARRDLERAMADVTSANTNALKEGARVLVRNLKRQVSVKGDRAHPSGPGEAPHLRTGRLRRSIGTEVVGGVRRVGYGRYVARLLAEGQFGRGGAGVPRDLFEPALTNSLEEMGGVIASAVQTGVEGGR